MPIYKFKKICLFVCVKCTSYDRPINLEVLPINITAKFRRVRAVAKSNDQLHHVCPSFGSRWKDIREEFEFKITATFFNLNYKDWLVDKYNINSAERL
jgi:hypothetical protein